MQIDWNYENQGNWGEVYLECSIGKSQSPINLQVHSSVYDSSLSTLTVNQEDIYHPSKDKMTLTNYGHSR